MTVPITLKEWLDEAQAMILKTPPFDADQLVFNAMVNVGSIKQYVVSTAPIERAYREVVAHAEDFRAVSAREGLPSDHSTASIEQARELTLLALERLDAALTDARPNDLARAMGMDWL